MLKRVLAMLTATTLSCATFAYGEAPALERLVKQGNLPAVAKRLPEKPEVVAPFESVGKYGGVLRSALRGNGDHNAILRLVGHQGLVRWSNDFSKIVPNLAESWSVNGDATEYTFKLRAGTRWSDGEPFTTDDILFYTQDLMLNKDFLATPPDLYRVADKTMVAEKLDDNTVRFRFAAPYVSFIENLAHPTGQQTVFYAKHYCQQFHPKYNPKLGELLKSTGVKDWGSLMRVRCGDLEQPTRWGNAARPTLDPWIVQDPYGSNSSLVTLRRNPYFWQVDSKGQQLPYIDELRLSVISEVETMVLAAVNGQLDFQVRHIGVIQNLPVLKESAEKNHYRVLQLEDISSNAAGLFLNQSTKNDKLRPFVRNKDFRIALSHAIDRKEIAEVVYLGQAIPWQLGPKKGNRFYNEQLATQYLAYDPAAANSMLDKLGLTQRDAEGFRLYPTGGRVSINGIVQISVSNYVDSMEVLRRQWAKVGVELVIQGMERSLFYDRSGANDYDMGIFVVGGGLDPQFDKTGVLAWSPLESRQSLPWVKWAMSGGKQGEEPSPSMKARLELHEKWKVARSQNEADALLRQILQLAADEFEVIGTVSTPRVPGVVSKRLMNVNGNMPWAWPYATPAGSLPQQYWFKS